MIRKWWKRNKWRFAPDPKGYWKPMEVKPLSLDFDTQAFPCHGPRWEWVEYK
jgi:hypothetical protein